MQVDLVLTPIDAPFARYVELAEAAEAAGFGTLWVLDHLSGATFGGATIAECWTLLAALAARTTRIGIGPLVTNCTVRPAPVVANMAATLQLVSGGRFELGLGAGAGAVGPYAAELHAAGLVVPELAERHARVVAVLDACERQWRPEAQRAPELAGFPRAEPVPPVVIGANTATLARLAGERGHGVNVPWFNARRAEVYAAARAAAEQAGRPAPQCSLLVPIEDDWLDDGSARRRGLAEEGITRLVLAVEPTDATVAQLAALPSVPPRS